MNNAHAGFSVGAVQMASGCNVAANLAQAREHIRTAAAEGARLVALPEFFAFMGRQDTDVLEICEEPSSGPIQDFLRNQAREHGVWLAGGSVALRAGESGRIRAACLLFDDGGRLVARYDKMHLFDVHVEGDSKRVYQESRLVEPGGKWCVVDTPFGRIGLAVCYDLRFPELFRAMAREGMETLILPSAFTAVTGMAHWEVLLRARAIENQCHVVAPAQGGYHVSGRETHGDSMIVDPWGTVLKRLPKGGGVIVHRIDPTVSRRLRRDFPALQHIRLGVNPP